MDSVVASGFFALGGVVLASVSGWVGAGLQRRWARIDAQGERAHADEKDREQRLFDHKREAYGAFLEQIGLMLTSTDEDQLGAIRSGLPELRRRQLQVSIYGSDDADSAANAMEELLYRLVDIQGSDDDGIGIEDMADEAARINLLFTNAVRLDLGIDHPSAEPPSPRA